MTWIDAAPIAAVCVAWLLIPGLLVGYGIGLRGVAAWAVAPIVTIAAVATLAAVAGMLRVPWSAPLAMLGCLIIAAVVAAVTFLIRHRAPARTADPRPVTLAAALGLAPALLLGTVTVIRGFGRPDALSETFDAVFHYNAVRFILDSRDASSLTIGSLGTPGLAGSFYPAAWHDFVSLIVLTTGSTIPAAANIFSAVVGILVWPLACLLLVRQVIGPSPAAMAVTGVLSLAFGAFPWGLLSFGVLWPNLLGMAIAPAGLAVVLSVCGLAKDDAIGRGRAWLLLPVTLVAAGFAHPNVVFSLVALSVVPVGIALARRARRGPRGVAEAVIAALVFAGGWWWAATTPAFAAVRNFYWAPIATPAHAVGQVLVNGTNGYSALWVLSGLVLMGAALCVRYGRCRPLVAGLVISGALYVLTAAHNRPWTRAITGYWYNDSHRLAAMIPIVAVPLAVAAVVFLARSLANRLPRWGSPPGVAAVLVVALLAVTAGLYVPSHVSVLAGHYTQPLSNPDSRLVDARERAFFARVHDAVPADSVVADNPWDGSVLLWALADRRTLFPHLGITTTPDQDYLAAHLIDAAADPRVCAVADRLRVGYLLIGDGTFWPWAPQRKDYPGLADPAGRKGFHLIDADGPIKLYRLTACATG
ncbi:MAG TPA: DUF6541 family protein [Pseudonocardiaceae bacterium]|jgi:hypothetical protein|nr:DUF6541 family protein [Pseudonocardiaceae bacterium]